MIGEQLLASAEKRFEFSNLPQVPGLSLMDLSCEVYREYDFGGRTYRISNPIGVYLRNGGTTHRVVDEKGVVHCVPTVGHLGCALRWVNKDPLNPVNF